MSCPSPRTEGGRREPSSIGPIICLRPRSMELRHTRPCWVEDPELTFPSSFGERRGPAAVARRSFPRGPAGEGKAGRSGLNFRPPARSRHVAAAPLGTAGKVQLEPGSRVRGEKVRRPPSPSPRRLVQPQTMEAQCFHSHFPLQGPVAPHPPTPPLPPRTPAPARSQRAVRRPTQPPPHSRILRPPRPHPPITRWAGHARSGCGAPSPVPGWGKRMSAEKGGLSPPAGGGCGSAIGEPPGQSARRRANGEPGETR